ICTSQKIMSENRYLVKPVQTTAEIRKAKELGKTGILYILQNAHEKEDHIGDLDIIKKIGVGIHQICYNTHKLHRTG
ncbi:membrane dipeptidase, partial [Pseudomonas syringae pv. tagetis]|uniref:membrane dipeptidase n=1 Tax=Pseudomonas syringae group genomosp. 7 TaxID=251699 RepID=UPI00376F8FA9